MNNRPGRAPIFKHPLEATSGDIGLRQILRHISQTKTCKRGIKDLKDIVENELAFDTHFEFSPTPFELPCVQSAIARKV